MKLKILSSSLEESHVALERFTLVDYRAMLYDSDDSLCSSPGVIIPARLYKYLGVFTHIL